MSTLGQLPCSWCSRVCSRRDEAGDPACWRCQSERNALIAKARDRKRDIDESRKDAIHRPCCAV